LLRFICLLLAHSVNSDSCREWSLSGIADNGYLLGDWSDAWATFAQNATSGKWEANGIDTLSRRCGGLKPETPVRSVEK
jgi:hypothetical protein